MMIHLVQDAATMLTSAAHWVDGLQTFDLQTVHSQIFHSLHLPSDLLILDKQIPPTDLMGDLQKWFNNFVKTGQAWAFVLGIVAGYLIKTFTSFG